MLKNIQKSNKMKWVTKMKRVKSIILLLIPLLMTGCTTTLKCEINTNNYTSTVKIKYENDKPTTYKYSDEMVFSEPLSTDSELYYHSKYQEYSYLITEKYATISNHNNKVKLKIDYDFTKDKTEDETKLLISKNDTIKIATEKIESSGYTCK